MSIVFKKQGLIVAVHDFSNRTSLQGSKQHCSEVGAQRCSTENVFRKYAANI